MPEKESHHTALLIIDVINDLDFPEGPELLKFARPMADRILELKKRAKQAGIPVIYVNDNFGRWRSDFRAQIEHCLKPQSRGREIVELLTPEEDDYFVLKPRHSGFYSTTLEPLLHDLKCQKLIMTGVATNMCVFFTANDAYMRDFTVVVPSDCSAANTLADHEYALQQMEFALKADIRPAEQLELESRS
ncbi:cysteine hydrolase family protein [Planctomicrobium sp. SH661]|uniref:cysteine hydrolase family protein n=1 Tax=Planctomicrobium sp. SH661 TaxID=3448124 RepID=UPI003F5C90B2